jgi:hypothetical protein
MQQRRGKNYTGRGGGLGAKAAPPVNTYLRQPTKILWCALILPPWRRTSTKAKECVGSHSFAQTLRPHITRQRQQIRWLALVCQVCTYLNTNSRPQWLRGLRHEPSSPTRTLGSSVRIPLKAWIPMCVYSVFVLFCVQVEALRRADALSKESYRLCID